MQARAQAMGERRMVERRRSVRVGIINHDGHEGHEGWRRKNKMQKTKKKKREKREERSEKYKMTLD